MTVSRRVLPDAPGRRGWCPGLAQPMPTGDGLLARIHPPLGILTLAQLRAVADAAERFGNGHIDVTARANLQLRGITEATRAGLVAALENAGLGDTRTDGGPQRLTLTSPLAGLSPALIDVPTLARAIEADGLTITGLPAKTLVLIEGGGATDLSDVAADIHVRATELGRAAIGLAGEDGIAWIATLREAAIAGAVALLVRVFAETGRRRIRDLGQYELAALAGTLSGSAFAGHPPPSAEEGGPRSGSGEGSAVSGEVAPLSRPSPTRGPPSPAEGGGGARIIRSHHEMYKSGSPQGSQTRASSDHGTRFLKTSHDAIEPSARIDPPTVLAIEAPFGRCTAIMLDRLADAAETLKTGDIRLSPARGFVLSARSSDADRRTQVVADLAAAGFITAPNDPRRAVAACPGAPACGSGSTPTGADAARLAEAFRPFAARGMTAHVSGCAKGCAHPGRADLTLVGRDGLYGIVLDGAPGDAPALELTFGVALERVWSATSGSLAQTFGRAYLEPALGTTP